VPSAARVVIRRNMEHAEEGLQNAIYYGEKGNAVRATESAKAAVEHMSGQGTQEASNK
jgi:hypothetical protein